MRPSASSSGVTEKHSDTLLPSGRRSQARRRRTVQAARKGLKPVAPSASVSSSSAGWPSRVPAGQPSAGSGNTKVSRPWLSVSNARSADSATISRQRCRLSSRALRIGWMCSAATVGMSGALAAEAMALFIGMLYP